MARSRVPKEILDALASVPMFSGLDKKHLEFVSGVTTETTVRANTTLVEQGTLGREAMILLDGAADVFRDGTKIDSAGAGDVIGEMSLVSHEPRTATVVTTEDSRLLVMNAREFSSLLAENPEVSMAILQTVVTRLARHEGGA
jgi:CRP-like cAMP-binding protein